MQAIETRYLGPTDMRGSRVKATTESGRTLTLDWDSALSSEANHTQCARMLAEQMEGGREWYRAGVKHGFVFVRADAHERAW